ncbi:hypothetical protein [Prescottella equi]|uniref:hypothetical protein n=1 Tax=Rhodococcus hoagii TaxID=43767 RepID=UPI001C846D64|nr:hypothetical protein [Prescottella equi]
MTTTDPPWYAWVIVAFAAFSSYLSASDNYYTQRDDEVPHEPIAAASLRHNIATLGLNRPNVPGLCEMVCYVPLGLLGPYVLDDAPTVVRLVCVAGALVYIGSCVCAVFLDPAFYNPEITMPIGIEWVREFVGPITAAIALAVIATAPTWDGETRTIVALMCLALLTIQVRIRETDRALLLARWFADNEQVRGRRAITQHVHSKVGAPIEALARYINRNKTDRDLYDQYRLAYGGYRELLAMDENANIPVDWPGLLAGRIRALNANGDTQFSLDAGEMILVGADREIAHLVLDDFATNALKAGARTCRLTLTYDPSLSRFTATAVDDGNRIKRWIYAGSGLERLGKGLMENGGELSYETMPNGMKKITGSWQSGARSWLNTSIANLGV